ncbi:hypothetical protein BC834DRAFT_841970 [Gloeopeniophorella convolvens]|nr:hypothetical protein BC834DRAFT_841970 [Gloeopeniophorella convolvens]
MLGPEGVKWWLPPPELVEDVEIVQDISDAPPPPQATQNEANNTGYDAEEEEEEDETPQPIPAPSTPYKSAQAEVMATGPVEDIEMIAPITAASPPQATAEVPDDSPSLNTQYAKGTHVNKVPMKHYNTALCGPCNFAGLECMLQDYEHSRGAYSCIACKDAKIRCWPPSEAALGRLYNAKDFRNDQREDVLITAHSLTTKSATIQMGSPDTVMHD